MTGLIEKIRSLTRGTGHRRTTPFASVGTTRAWLENLPSSSDYDAHHALVEGLERYNGDDRGDVVNRIKVLRLMEEAGLPLQAVIVDQYLKSYDANESARQALWRECRLFWDQLSLAYLPFLRIALRSADKGKLEPWSTEIAVKSLRYLSLNMRWEYLRGKRPAESAWRRLHKFYRMVEIAGEVLGEVEVEGRTTSCTREYVMALLIDLSDPHAFSAGHVRLVLEILDSLEGLPIPEGGLNRDRHTHMVDLSSSAGPEKIEDRWVPGKRLRYLDLSGVLHQLEQRAAHAQGTPQGLLCKQLIRVIGRAGAHRGGPRKPLFGEVQVVFGVDAVLKAYSPYRGIVTNTEILTLRDESNKGLGFVLPEERVLQSGSLLAVKRDEGHGAWQLLTVRWQREEGAQWLIGAESLSKHPKRVDVEWDIGGPTKEIQTALFLPLTNTSQGVTSILLLPQAAYALGRMVMLRDDGMRYRLQLGKIVETHESWVRVRFDVLAQDSALEMQ